VREPYKARVSSALALDISLDLALAPARARRASALNLARLRALNLDTIETLSLLLSGLSKPGSDSAAGYADLFLAAALALEQQAGKIPPHPAGIALVRQKVK
jgi:hypothetical protein